MEMSVVTLPNARRTSCGRPRGGRKDALIEAPYDNRRGAKAILPYLVPPGSFMRGLGANALHLTRLGHRDGG
jgi:hypothetical protein